MNTVFRNTFLSLAIFILASTLAGCSASSNDQSFDEENYRENNDTVDIFIKIGAIKGGSIDPKHRDEIDVLSWHWGTGEEVANTENPDAESIQVHDLTFTKHVDKASPDLMLYCAIGKHIDKALLIACETGEQQLEYLTITMQDVVITSVSTGEGLDDRLTENVTLNFARVQMQYREQEQR